MFSLQANHRSLEPEDPSDRRLSCEEPAACNGRSGPVLDATRAVVSRVRVVSYQNLIVTISLPPCAERAPRLPWPWRSPWHASSPGGRRAALRRFRGNARRRSAACGPGRRCRLCGPAAVVGETPFVPLAERAVGLPTQPVPGQFDQKATHVRVARLADALFAAALARIERRGRQPHDGADLPAIAEGTPAE
jgi:hypothetical protein